MMFFWIIPVLLLVLLLVWMMLGAPKTRSGPSAREPGETLSDGGADGER